MQPSPATSGAVTGSAPKIILPDDIKTVVRTYAEQTGTVRRELAYAIKDFMDEVPYGMKMAAYELVAHEWNDATGDGVSARTVRHWMHSISVYAINDLRHYYQPLSQSQLIEAVSLAEIAKVTPQEICAWAVEQQISSVPTMRAHWLPPTSTDYEIDPGWLSGLKRTANKLLPAQDPRWPRVKELFAELREILK